MIDEDEARRIEGSYHQEGEQALYSAILLFGADKAALDATVSCCLDDIYFAFFEAGGADGRILGRAQEAFWCGFDSNRHRLALVSAGGHA